MQLNLRRAIITLLWAGSLILAGPAIGYAQAATERLSPQATAWEQQSDLSAYDPMKSDVRDDSAEPVR